MTHLPLIAQIKKDSIAARVAKESIKANLLVTLISDITKVGKDAKPPRETTEQEAIAVIKKYLKGAQETKDAVTKSMYSRVEKLEDKSFSEHEINQKSQIDLEINILNSYLPKQMSREELETIIKGLNTKNVGEIMKHLKDNHAGLYDGKVASEIAKSL